MDDTLCMGIEMLRLDNQMHGVHGPRIDTSPLKANLPSFYLSWYLISHNLCLNTSIVACLYDGILNFSTRFMASDI